MKRCYALCLLPVWLTLSVAQAAPSAARLSLKSEGAGNLVVISTSDGSSLVNATPKGLSLDQKVTASEWTKVSITFKATQDSVIRLRLSGSWVKDGHLWVLVDNLHASGAEIENPDFENGLHKKLAPDGWKFLRKNATVMASTILDPAVAASGKVCIKVSDSTAIIQRFSIRQDKTVTISFSARLASSAPQP